jgi:hypothetical protein
MKKVAFTICLNGMPFIMRQAQIIPEIFDKWYIIEGYSLPVKDTDWCKHINIDEFTNNGLSNDGTTEFLDKIKSDKIEIIRKPIGEFWQGKTEMCNSFMNDLENCVLMQFDMDEIWNPDVLRDVLSYAENNDDFDSMLFRCNYYVGHDLVITDTNCFGNKDFEWQRLWKIRNKTKWLSHEPPSIEATTNVILKHETEKRGWIFDHFAYLLTKQIQFKEKYYGYEGATRAWQIMQKCPDRRFNIKRYFTWLTDDAIVNRQK